MDAIVAVDATWTLASADEDESESVALACVEFLFAETNAYYTQHVLARRTLQRVSRNVAGNIVDAVCAAVLCAEQPLSAQCFRSEHDPEPSVKDRHSVRALQCRSPERHNNSDALSGVTRNGVSSPSRDSRSSSSPDKITHASAMPHNSHVVIRRRRKAPDKPMPEVFAMPDNDDEDPETKAWRAKCLQQLTTSKRRLSSFTKWATVARAFAPPSIDANVSREVEIVESASSLLLLQQLNNDKRSSSDAPSSAGVKMKTNIDSFAAVVDVVPTDSDKQQTQHASQASNASAAAIAAITNKQLKNSSNVVLYDKLSRKKSALSGVSSRRRSSVQQQQQRAFVPEHSDFNATTLPTTMQLASGVVLSQGESVIEGPERLESANTMSRKRFDLHQSLTTDLLLHWNDRDAMSRSGASSVGSPSYSHSHYHYHTLDPRPYEEVPAEPIPAPPFLSPIPTAALAIPRTHLAQSLSAPALRVRSAAHTKSARGATATPQMGASASAATLPTSDTLRQPRLRPSTAASQSTTSAAAASLAARPSLRSAAAPSAGGRSTTSKRGGSAAAAKYQREFPKPHAGVVKLSQLDEAKRLAWISP